MRWNRAFPVLVAVVCAATLAGGGVAQATTLRGIGGAGVVNVPTPDGGPRGELTIGLTATTESRTYSFVRYQLYDDLDLGVTVTDFGRSGAGLLARLRLLRERGLLPSVAVGIEGVDGFVVASHALPMPFVRVHAGARTGEPGGLFAGLSAVLNPVNVTAPGRLSPPVVTIGADYDVDTFNAGMTLQFGPHFQINLGFVDEGELRFVAGASISTVL